MKNDVAVGAGTDLLELGVLQPGDILLMMGEGPLSDLIAWASDGRYSHAAIVVGGGELIEASLGGVRRYALHERVLDQAHFHYIDVFRMPGLSDASDQDRVREHAQTLLGAPYPVDQLALFGVIMAVRGKWPKHPIARHLVRLALDRALPTQSPAMVCSEVVYRALAECVVDPRGRLAPRIVEGEQGTAPFPEIDWEALADEFLPLIKPKTVGVAKSNEPASEGVGTFDERVHDALLDGTAVDDDDLDAARAKVLAHLSGRGLLKAGVADIAGFDPLPNPRLVSPQDLANSPNVIAVGRLMQRAET